MTCECIAYLAQAGWEGNMSFIAKLSIKGRSLDLNGDTFAIASSFVPPATNSAPLLASGTSANRRGGSTKVGQRAYDISVTLPVYITGTSEPEIQSARRQLASFMQQAGQSETDPLIFEWRGNDDGGFFLVFSFFHGLVCEHEIQIK